MKIILLGQWFQWGINDYLYRGQLVVHYLVVPSRVGIMKIVLSGQVYRVVQLGLK
jgi:hypothetical protein